jgi:hypothetical protein
MFGTLKCIFERAGKVQQRRSGMRILDKSVMGKLMQRVADAPQSGGTLLGCRIPDPYFPSGARKDVRP